MAWIEEVRAKVTRAMRDRDDATKSILKVLLGDLQAAESRQSTPLTREQGAGVVRKILKSNEETIALTKDEATKARLAQENTVLAGMLPKSLSADEIAAMLAPVADAVKGAGNDGQATGVAMKHLKAQGAVVEGKDVAAAVKKIRG